MKRTLILLYAYKALPKTEPVSDTFTGGVLPLDESTYFGNAITGDCYVALARRWLESGVVDAVKGIAVQYPAGHARHSPAGVMKIAPGFDFYVLEDLRQYASVHVPGERDIVWIRGQPPWEPVLELHQGAYRLFYNGAGSSPDKWRPRFPVDAILVDDPACLVDARCVEFTKCADEDVFRPLDLPRPYDFCFVARFDPRDTKGHLEFARRANRRWKGIFAGEVADAETLRELKRLWPQCEIVEGASKSEVNEILNRSKVSIVNSAAHDGCPRIVVESLAAGTPVLVNRRNLARKYVQRGAGLVAPTRAMRLALEWMVRRHASYRPLDVYNQHFHSRVSAAALASRLFHARVRELAHV